MLPFDFKSIQFSIYMERKLVVHDIYVLHFNWDSAWKYNFRAFAIEAPSLQMYKP